MSDYAKEYKKINSVRYAEYQTDYRSSDRGVEVRREYRATDHGKEVIKKATIRTRAKHPEKRIAQSAVSAAIKNGKLIRGNCEKCGATELIHGHHDDYSKPLEVRWLCPKHHTEHHREVA